MALQFNLMFAYYFQRFNNSAFATEMDTGTTPPRHRLPNVPFRAFFEPDFKGYEQTTLSPEKWLLTRQNIAS